MLNQDERLLPDTMILKSHHLLKTTTQLWLNIEGKDWTESIPTAAGPKHFTTYSSSFFSVKAKYIKNPNTNNNVI